MSEEKIGIIIPCYNAEKYIERCLTSIVNQTYKNIVVYIVDDCSTDKSEEMLKSWCHKDARIIYNRNSKNSGVAKTRNKGIELALAHPEINYITFVDIDDYVSNKYVEVLYSLLKEHNADISWVSGVISGYDEEQYKFGDSLSKIEIQQYAGKELLLHLNERILYSMFWCKLFKKDLWKNIRINENYRWDEDAATTFQILYLAKKIIRSEEVLYVNYFSKTSLTRSSYSKERIMCEMNKAKEKISFYRKMNENKLLSVAYVEYYNDLCDAYMKCKINSINDSVLLNECVTNLNSMYPFVTRNNQFISKNQRFKFFLFKYFPNIGLHFLKIWKRSMV